MKKLTKEQADWLINKLSQYCFMAPIMNDVEMSVTRADLLKLLNQCTEKEFPEFKLETDSPSLYLSLSLFEPGGKRVMLKVVDGEELSFNLYVNEFKQFTAGCNEIVRWLEEQKK